jgi:hypothetical protein
MPAIDVLNCNRPEPRPVATDRVLMWNPWKIHPGKKNRLLILGRYAGYLSTRAEGEPCHNNQAEQSSHETKRLPPLPGMCHLPMTHRTQPHANHCGPAMPRRRRPGARRRPFFPCPRSDSTNASLPVNSCQELLVRPELRDVRSHRSYSMRRNMHEPPFAHRHENDPRIFEGRSVRLDTGRVWC